MSKTIALVKSDKFRLILLITFLINTGTGIISPIISGLLRDYGYDYFQASIPFVFLVLGRIISKVFSGSLIQKIGSKNTVQLFCALYFLVFILYIFSTDYLVISILRFLEGLVEGIVVVVLMDYAIEYSGEKKGQQMGMFSAAIGLGFIVGPFISGLILNLFDDISYVFIIASLAGLISFLITRIKLPNIETKPRPVLSMSKMAFSIVKEYSGIYSPSYLRRILFFALMIILPFHLIDVFEQNYAYASTFFMVSAIITTTCMTFAGKISDRKNARKIALYSLLIISASIFLFPFAKNIYLFWVLFIIETFAFTFMLPSSMKIFAETIEKKPLRTEILGWLGAMTEFITLILSFIIPIVYKQSPMYAWIFLSCIALIVAIWFSSSSKSYNLKT
jgi:MFS family permease